MTRRRLVEQPGEVGAAAVNRVLDPRTVDLDPRDVGADGTGGDPDDGDDRRAAGHVGDGASGGGRCDDGPGVTLDDQIVLVPRDDHRLVVGAPADHDLRRVRSRRDRGLDAVVSGRGAVVVVVVQMDVRRGAHKERDGSVRPRDRGGHEQAPPATTSAARAVTIVVLLRMLSPFVKRSTRTGPPGVPPRPLHAIRRCDLPPRIIQRSYDKGSRHAGHRQL